LWGADVCFTSGFWTGVGYIFGEEATGGGNTGVETRELFGSQGGELLDLKLVQPW